MIRNIIRKLKSMPETLAITSCACLGLGPLLIVTTLIPAERVNSHGEVLTYSELWHSWVGPLLVLLGIVMTIFAWASFRRWRWVRYLWPLFFSLMIIHAFIDGSDEMESQWIEAFGGLLISSWYFFRKKRVVEYFKETS